MLTKREDIEKRTEELLQPIVDAHQFELVDVEFVKEGGNRYLRAYIDKPGGITVNDCEAVSRVFNEVLDRAFTVPGTARRSSGAALRLTTTQASPLRTRTGNALCFPGPTSP